MSGHSAVARCAMVNVGMLAHRRCLTILPLWRLLGRDHETEMQWMSG